MTVNFGNIPEPLTSIPQWGMWRYVSVPGRPKPTKPFYSVHGYKVDLTNPTNWTDFETVKDAYINKKSFDGIGFVMTENLGIVGTDLDKCRCPAFVQSHGVEIIAPWAQEIITELDSYTEITPSNKGFRIFTRGKIPVDGRKEGPAEMYQHGHYLTLTGNHLAGTPTQIMERQPQIDAVFNRIFGTKKETPKIEKSAPRANVNVSSVLEKMFSSKHGEKIKALFDGNSDHTSDSEKDLSLCGHLAYWSDNDAVIMDAAFRQSALMRPKWDERHYSSGQTYGQKTIETAITGNPKQNTENTGFESFPELEPFDRFTTEPISANILPGVFGEYADAIATSTQTPSGLSVAMLITVLAASLQKKFVVEPMPDYREPCCLWFCSLLPPASRKSTVAKSAIRPLVKWEADQIKGMAAKVREVNVKREVAQRRIENLVKKSANATTTDAERETFRAEILTIEMETPAPMVVPKLFVDDITAEALQGKLVENDESMSLISAEGGIFATMSGLYSNGGNFNNNVFLQAHAGDPVRVDRQGRSVTMNHPTLSFGLAIQPSIFSDMADSVQQKHRGIGLLARFLYVYPENMVGKRNVYQTYQIPFGLADAFDQEVRELLEIEQNKDFAGESVPYVLTLSADAKALWLDFSDRIEKRMDEIDGDLCNIQDWAGKLPGAVARVAGLLHVAKHRLFELCVDADSMQRAVTLGTLLCSHAKAVFGLMQTDASNSDAKVILKWIMENQIKSFSQREAYDRFKSRFKTVDRAKDALSELSGRHYISEPQTVHTGGRPSVHYNVNPILFK